MNPEEFTPLTKELAQKYMEMKGECRGMGIKSDWDVIRQWKGEEGVRKLEAKMAELGYPLKYEEIKSMAFYPIGFDILEMLVMRDVFGFNEEDFEKLGRATTKFSFFIKILLQYFLSIKSVVAQAPRIWRQHYTVGDTEVVDVNEKEKYILLRLKNFSPHSIFCAVLKGFLLELLKMIIGPSSSPTCEETKCVFKGDEYHEFLLRW